MEGSPWAQAMVSKVAGLLPYLYGGYGYGAHGDRQPPLGVLLNVDLQFLRQRPGSHHGSREIIDDDE